MFARRYFPAIGAASIAVPIVRRTGGDRYIHHGRRPVLPPLSLPLKELPLLPEPPPQLYVFFERGITRLTLFILGRTTTSIRESHQDQTWAIRDNLEVQGNIQWFIAECQTSNLELKPSILLKRVEIQDRITNIVPFVESSAIIAARLPRSERIHERIDLRNEWCVSLAVGEWGTTSAAFSETSQLTWEFRENLKESLQISDKSGTTEDLSWTSLNLSETALMEAIALAIVQLLEEEL